MRIETVAEDGTVLESAEIRYTGRTALGIKQIEICGPINGRIIAAKKAVMAANRGERDIDLALCHQYLAIRIA